MHFMKEINKEIYIENLFRNLSNQKEILVVVRFGKAQLMAMMIFKAKRGTEPELKFENTIDFFKLGDSVEINFVNKGVFFYFQSKVTSLIGDTCQIEKPKAVFTSLSRVTSKFRFEETEAAYISIGSSTKVFRLLDISVKGLSFLSDEKLFTPGQRIKEMVVKIEGTAEVSVDGRIKYIKKESNGAYVYELRFIDINWDKHYKIFKYIFKKRYPDLDFFNEFSEEALTDLYEKAMLTNQLADIEGKQIVSNKMNVLKRLSDKPVISNGLVYQENGIPLAFGSLLRIYNNTYLGHHAVTLPEIKTNPKAAMRVYIGQADFMLAHMFCKYYINYVTSDFEWHDEIFLSMNEIINNTEAFIYDHLQLLQCDTKMIEDWEFETDFKCEIMNHLDGFIKYCRNTMKPLEFESYGYDSFETEQIYSSAGLSKSRQVWCVTKDNCVHAYVVAEAYPDAFDMVNITDNCRIFFLQDDDNVKDIIKATLSVVSLFYKKHNKTKFNVLLASALTIKDLMISGVEYRDEVGRVIMNRRGIKEYKNLLQDNFLNYTRYYPLTHPQLAIWYTEKVYPGTSFGNISSSVCIKGDINYRLLELAIRLVVEKNDAMRLRISNIEGIPAQYISTYKHIKYDFYDFSHLSEDSSRINWNEYNTSLPFNLIDSDLFKFILFKANSNEGGYFLKIHHMISDGWSLILLASEIVETYAKLKKGIEIDETKKYSYIDFIASEQSYKDSNLFLKHKKYWDERFESIPEFTSLKPSDYGYRSTKAERISHTFSKDLTTKIHQYCSDEKVSPFSVFLSILYIYINRITSKTDVVLGAPILNRGNAKEKEMIGMFISMVPLRMSVDPTLSFKTFVEYISKEFMAILKNQKYPYDLILKDFRERHNTNDNLFDITLSYQNGKLNKTEITGDYNILWHFNGSQTNSLQIHISDWGDEGQYVFELDYLVDVLDKEEVDRIYSGCLNLLIEALEKPQDKICTLSLISLKEREKILYEFNNTNEQYPRSRTIQALFKEQVGRTPNNIAVVFNDKRITYSELDLKTNSLARRLRKRGIKSGSIVALLANPSIELIIGIIAVLKSGGAYLPIDPDYPVGRIDYMLKDSNAAVILSNSSFFQNEAYSDIMIDLDDKDIFLDDYNSLEDINDANDLAYVIYTSGSTGMPKGVMVEHKALINLCYWHIRNFDVTSNDRASKYAGIGFDASVWEIFPYLLAGASIFIIDKNIKIELEALNNYFIKNGITMGFLPTQICERFMELENTSLRCLLTGADKLKRYINKNYKLYNNYGPTENTVVTTSGLIEKQSGNIPIGKPISNTRVYILDTYYNLQPILTPGELFISGENLARGYLKRAELTREKFLDNPFMPNEKMYRTGDIARWLPDGNIQFLGRTDFQVKIRGFRIELGEIENCLLNHELVDDAIVKSIQDENGDNYLCAYYISKEIISAESLKLYLSNQLPQYMIPSYFLRLDSIPVTSNGKIDRAALPEPKKKQMLSTNYAAPQNELEKKIAEIWCQVLIVDKVGMEDRFFEAGGDSLKAITLISKIHKELKFDMPISQIFSHQTIREQAKVIKESVKETLCYAIQPIRESEYYQTSSAQKRMYLLNQIEPGTIHYNMPATIIFDGDIDEDRLRNALEKLVLRHEVLRTSFWFIENGIVQRIHNNEEIELEMVYDKSSITLESAALDFIRPFFLDQAPLIRTKLVKLDVKKHALLIDMHHIICDGVSMGILLKDLAALYTGKGLEPKRLQYKDFAAWQNEFLKTLDLKKQEEYWINLFKGEIPILSLPTDFGRPPVQSHQGDNITFRIENVMRDKLIDLARNTGSTLFMVLLAAYNILLAKYSGQEDIIVGTPIAGRSHADTWDLVGMFVNTLALRNNPRQNMHFVEFIEKLRVNCINAFENQDYQFENLVEKLEIKRDMSRNPLFDTMFIMQNVDIPELKADNLKIHLETLEFKVSKFDLTMQVIEDSNGLNFNIEYCTCLFKRNTIERFAGHFLRIIEEILRNPASKISEIDILTTNENQQLFEFNNTKSEYSIHKSVYELFELQAEKTPEKTAVIYRDSKLTYRQLNEKSNQLARYLREKGVRPNMIVAVMVERSFEMMIGLMSIFKAGGAYLPIDPNYPVERIKYILEDSNSVMLLTQNRFLEKIDNEIEIINIEDRNIFINDISKLEKINKPNDLAYVIYTSGSTGKPKGVMIEHYSLINKLLWRQKHYKLGSKDIILQKTPYFFDISVWELFWWSFTGAAICFLEPGGEKDPEEIVRTVEKNRVTVIHFVPSMLNIFMEYIEKNIDISRLQTLKYIFASGEALTEDQVIRSNRLLLDRFNTTLHNLYGPTEATIEVTYFDCSGIQDGDSIPIGKPIDNVRLYIIDKYNNQVPVGIHGELCIAGDCLARGYLNKSQLTAEKFVDNPFELGRKMYKTGDLAKWRSDGNIEYLGRIDNQVKIRGFRIELGEIESQLMKIRGISKAAVIDREINGKTILCAYYVSYDQIEIHEIKERLLRELPEYMIPSYFTCMQDLPLSPTGKLDRKSLPLPISGIESSDHMYVAPSNDVERILASAWEEVLRIDRIGLADNFFELGGDSLAVIRVLSSVYSNGWSLGIQDFYKYKTLGELSNKIKGIYQNDNNIIKNKSDIINDSLEINLDKGNEAFDLDKKSILITGATGFLGIHILDCMIKRTKGDIYCLIRDKQGIAALERLKESLNYYFEGKHITLLGNRLHVISGDITLENFGLSEDVYQELNEKINVVIHSAAIVKHYGEYGEFEKINIQGTKNIIAFSETNNKRLCHISTLSIAGTTLEGNEDSAYFTEKDFYIGQNFEDNVYVKSKFEAERLIYKAIGSGLDAFICRMGNITGRDADGLFQVNVSENAFYNMLKSTILLGGISSSMTKLKIEFSPVDYCADAVVKIAGFKVFNTRIFHIYNHNKMDFEALVKQFDEIGYKIQILSDADFHNRITMISKDKNKKDYLRGIINILTDTEISATKEVIKTSADLTLNQLKNEGFEWPIITNVYIIKIIGFLRSIGFIS